MDLDFDLSQALLVFDELLPLSEEERKLYWLRYRRKDDISLTLLVSVYDADVTIIVRSNGDKVAVSSLHLTDCGMVRFLESNTFEIVSREGGRSKYRCFVALDGETLIDMES